MAGAGAAGRSFVYHLLRSPLRNSRVLLIDREQKTTDDRTWCFWEDKAGPFEEIVHARWKQLWFHNDAFSRLLDIQPFEYKMIRSSDYYAFTDQDFQDHNNIEVLYANIKSIEESSTTGVSVSTDAGTYQATWCIDSVQPVKIDKSKVNYLDQHFRGWFIETEVDTFDPEVATLMDFRIPQNEEFRFVYVMPITARTALVEFTIFSNDHLTPQEYDQAIKDYLKTHIPTLGKYQIKQVEQGNIPMTDHQFPRQKGKIIKVGAFAGDTRASTGYTFIYIHQRIQQIIEALVQQKTLSPSRSLFQRRHHYYDSIMLQVLQKEKGPGARLFGFLFQRNPPARLLRFLSGQTTFAEEIAIMSTMPIPLFTKALIKVIFR